MWTPENGWTMSAACLTLTLLVTGCASGVSGTAVCDGTKAARTAHAEALAQDGGDLSVQTGATLIAMLDAGCRQ